MGTQLGNQGSTSGALSPTIDAAIEQSHTPMKRVFDFVAAAGLLVAVSPLMLVVGLLTRLHDGETALFSQERVGRGGRLFRCYKIRSMVPDAQARLNGILASDPIAREEWDLHQKLTNDPRVTPLGHFIRKTSLDELPQLWNVMKGEMSLVGPRPISVAETVRYGEAMADYRSVRPGLTGLWQVSGRSDVDYATRVALDQTYARERTFWGDVRILLLTIPAVMKSRGAR
jgi:exopolysaccharide production protein ExoY